MVHVRKRVVFVAGLACALAYLPAATAQAGSASRPGTLSSTPNPGLLNYLWGVTAISPSNAWAVGNYCTSKCYKPGERDRSMILHWNGAAWSRVASPNPGNFYDTLTGIDAVSSKDIWAAGAYFGTRSAGALVLHWNGRKWSRSSIHSSTVSDLSAVSAVSPKDVWAVGQGGSGRKTVTVTMRWNGRKWSRVASPSPGKQSSVLTAVSARTKNDVWAAGYYCTAKCSSRTSPPVDHTLILHWDGRRWSRVSSPGSNADVTAVHGISASNAWASVSTSTGSLLLHWNGSTWSKFKAPRAGQIMALAFSAPNDGWAAAYGVFLHWNGAKWSAFPVKVPTSGNLYAASADSANDAWAVGFACSSRCGGSHPPYWHTFALHWNGTSWTSK